MTLSAIRAEFPLGTRVRINGARAPWATLHQRERIGTVCGWSREGDALWILWDGVQYKQAWLCAWVERA